MLVGSFQPFLIDVNTRDTAFEFLPKIKLEIVVLDENLSKILDAIIREARTGSIGDGKIFVYDVADAIRIRTGDYGDNAI